MGTTIRPEVSKRNKYWIEKHRYYELKHFCLQYPIWKKACNSLDGMSKRTFMDTNVSRTNVINNPTLKCVEARIFYLNRMGMIEDTTNSTDEYLSLYLLKGVTEGLSYDSLKVIHDIPCCRDVYYDLYRKFFWILNKVRG